MKHYEYRKILSDMVYAAHKSKDKFITEAWIDDYIESEIKDTMSDKHKEILIKDFKYEVLVV